MHFLIDNALSPLVASSLRSAGHDAVHVRDYQLQTASDAEVLERADSEDRTLVTADTDFGTLLAQRGTKGPSVIIFRRGIERRPAGQVEVLLANLAVLEDDLRSGSVVVIEHSRMRIKSLPLPGTGA